MAVKNKQCEAVCECQSSNHAHRYGQPYPCEDPAHGIVVVDGKLRSLCWVHTKAAHNPHRVKPLEFVER